MIGVHRNFVRQIRNTKARVQLEKVQHRHRGSRLLQAWATDWQFLTAAGLPRDLPIRADPPEPSFQMLVRKHMPGVSIGIAIAELRRSGAVSLLPDEQIRLRSRSARPAMISSATIATVSERMRDFASTLLHNLKRSEDQRFCASLDELQIDPQRVAVVRHIITKRGQVFLDELATELSYEAQKSDARTRTLRIGLTMFGYENNEPTDRKKRHSFS